ncbi:MAG: glycerol-3-phosphate 1-O-acyltransferase PlsY [Planctomycetota bacterium]|nr:glycerol-3-phosphate 1-O-acyltransferase PlsY [Planctomycetota bacterium]
MFRLIVLSYFSGSVPFGLLIGFLAGKDVRLAGSHNIGASNVWRLCGWKCGLATFSLDFIKGLAPVIWFAESSATDPAPYSAILAAFLTVLGHNFPIWLGFRGGKGVATSAGAAAGLMPLPFVIAFSSFALTVAFWRYTSLGSMLSSLVLAGAAFLLLPDPLGTNLPLLLLAMALSAMIFIRHRHNIARIRAGTENRFPPPKPEEFEETMKGDAG